MASSSHCKKDYYTAITWPHCSTTPWLFYLQIIDFISFKSKHASDLSLVCFVIINHCVHVFLICKFPANNIQILWQYTENIISNTSDYVRFVTKQCLKHTLRNCYLRKISVCCICSFYQNYLENIVTLTQWRIIF
jgi:uncharacterized protein with PQ loop repeat